MRRWGDLEGRAGEAMSAQKATLRHSLEQLLLSPVPEPMLQEEDSPLVHVPVRDCPEEAHQGGTGGDQVGLGHTNGIHSSTHTDQLAGAAAKEQRNSSNSQLLNLLTG